MSGKIRMAALFAMPALMAGCADVSLDAPAPVTEKSQVAAPNTVKSADGTLDGKIIGIPAPDSKFAKLKIGMSIREVTGLIGAPDSTDRRETGKRWIPFYSGTDAQRLRALYKGEGCLTYTAGNVHGEGGAQLIWIVVDPAGACFTE